MRRTVPVLLTPLVLLVAACQPAPEVVSFVDLEQYAGKWYEIARLPVQFQEGCVATTAEYSLRDDGLVGVVNTCREDTVDGPERSIEGTARVVDPETNAKLAVTFFWPFEGPYWIVMLDDDYAWAVVSNPNRSNLWILSRTPQLPDATYDAIIDELTERSFDLSNLMLTPQPTNEMADAS